MASGSPRKILWRPKPNNLIALSRPTAIYTDPPHGLTSYTAGQQPHQHQHQAQHLARLSSTHAQVVTPPASTLAALQYTYGAAAHSALNSRSNLQTATLSAETNVPSTQQTATMNGTTNLQQLANDMAADANAFRSMFEMIGSQPVRATTSRPETGHLTQTSKSERCFARSLGESCCFAKSLTGLVRKVLSSRQQEIGKKDVLRS